MASYGDRKAFNGVFAKNIGRGQTSPERLAAMIAGDKGDTRNIVMRSAGDIGFEAYNTRPLRSARYLEPMGIELMIIGSKTGWSNLGHYLVRS